MGYDIVLTTLSKDMIATKKLNLVKDPGTKKKTPPLLSMLPER
jgi:hypothetical protein